MLWLKRLVLLLLLLVVAVVTVVFVIDNRTDIGLSFMGYQSLSLPVSAFLVMAFVIGALFGFLVGLASHLRYRLRGRRRQATKAVSAVTTSS